MVDAAAPLLIPMAPPDAQPLVWTPRDVLRGQAVQRAWILYQDPSAQFSAGIWECDEGAWTVHYTECEYVQMLAGRILIIDAQGQRRVVGPLDSFVVPVGFSGSWEVLEPARKYFAVFEQTGAPLES